MTWIPVKVPKPSGKLVGGGKPRPRKRMKKSRMRCGAGSKRRGKSSFPKQRDKRYTRWLTTENLCLLAGRRTTLEITPIDRHRAVMTPKWVHFWEHICWSTGDRPPLDPAHVGKHRSKGAPDFGATVPLCHAAHAFYDTRRDEWKRATGFSEKQMASEAAGYGLRYVERGGIPTQGEP